MVRLHPPPTKHNMKHPHSPRGGRFLLLGTLCLGLAGISFAQENIPRGNLSVDKSLVRVGAQSQLQWQIRYNETITSIVEILNPPVISPKETLDLRVRVLAPSPARVKSNNGHGNNIDGVDSSNPGKGVGGPTGKKNSGEDPSGGVDDERHAHHQTSAHSDMPVEIMWSVNSSDWSRIFYGLQSSVVPTDLVLETTVQKGDTIKFGSRAFTNKWLPLYHTGSASPNVIVLKNGDPVPDQIARQQYAQLKDYIKPYLSTNGKTVRIGNRDLLVLFELDESNPNAVGFDFQDIAILVTFD